MTVSLLRPNTLASTHTVTSSNRTQCRALLYHATTAVQRVEALLRDSTVDAPVKIGARVVFVDLAGAEFNDNSVSSNPRTNQSAADKKATRQINTDLMTLKEVVRAHASRQQRIPFRGSPLTMVLREHFVGGSHASIIVTVSKEREQSAATLNTLRFASTAAS